MSTMEDHKIRFSSSSLHTSKYTRIMENFKKLVFKHANSHLNTPLTSSQITFIEQKLLSTFPVFYTPTHPTYSSMIESAIKELNEEDGSKEESISKYIKEHYGSLPWAHSIYVSHHLSKMQKNGELICTSSKLYTTTRLIEERNMKNKQPRRRSGRKTRGCVIEEENSVAEKVVVESGDLMEFQKEKNQVFGRSRMKRRRRSCMVDEEDDEVGGAEVVGGDHNVVSTSSSQNLGVEDDGHVTGKRRLPRLKLKLLVDEEDDEVEGAVVVGERNVSSGSQNLVAEKCNKVVDEEDGDGVTGRSRLKRKRWSCVVVDDDDEVWGATVVAGEHNITRSSQNLVVEKCAEMVEVEDGVDITRKAIGMSEEWGDIGTVGEDDVLNEPPTELQFEINSQALPLDEDECAGKTEPELSVPLPMGILNAEPEGKDKNEMMNMPDDKPAANSVLVPVDCVKKSSLNIASNIKVDHPEVAVKESFLKENELKIVPFVDSTPISAVNGGIITERGDNIIVCGLPVPNLEQPKRKKQVYFSKKRSKACQRKIEVTSKSVPSIAALAVGQNLLDRGPVPELSSQRGVESELCETLLESLKVKELPACQSQQACTSSFPEDGSMEQLHYLSSLEDLIPAEYEENSPLQQVLEKCGKQKRHAAQLLTANTPLPIESSSISGSKLHLNLQNSVESVTKRKEPPPEQWQLQFKPQEKKLCSFEVDTAAATGSKTSPFLIMEKWRNRQRHIEHEPLFFIDSAEKNVDMVHQNQQQSQGQGQGSSNLKLTVETFAFDDKGRYWEEKTQTRSDHDLPCEPEQSTEITTVESSPILHLNGKEDELNIGETVKTALMEEKMPMLRQDSQQFTDQQKEAKEETTATCSLLQHQCIWQKIGPSGSASNLIVEGPSESATDLIVEEISSMCRIDKVSSHALVTELPEVKQSILVTEHVASDILQSEQEKHQKQHITKSPFSEPSLQHEIEDQEVNSETDVRLQCLQDLEATMATVVEENIFTTYQKFEQQIKQERELRQRPWKQLELSKEDVVTSSSEHLQQQVGMPLYASYQNLKQQNKQQKVRGRPRNEKRATTGEVVDSLNLQPQLQGLSELAIVQHSQQQREQPKKRGRPRKYTEETKGSAAAVHLQKQGLSEPSFDENSQREIKQPKKGGTGRQRKKIGAVKEDKPVASKFHIQLQEPYEPSTGQQSQQLTEQVTNIGLWRPWKQRKEINEDEVAPLNLHVPQQEGLSESVIGGHSQQQIIQLKTDGRVRTRRQIQGAKEDAVASSNLHLQQHAGSSEPEKSQNEVHGTPETRQAMPPSDEDNCQLPKKQKLYCGSQHPKTRAMTTASDNQPIQQEEELQCHELAAASSNLHLQQHAESSGPVKSQSEVQGTPETRQAMPPSDEDNHQLPNKQKLNSGFQRPKTRAMTTASDYQPSQQEEERLCHEHAAASSNLHLQHHAESSEPEKSQSEAHKTPETGQAMPPSDEDNCQLPNKQKLYSGFQRPKTRAMTTASDNQPSQQEEELQCHELAAASSNLHLQQHAESSEPVKSQSEVQGTPETGQAMPPTDENNHQLPNKQKLYSGFQRPKTRAMTTALDNQPSQHEEELQCHELAAVSSNLRLQHVTESSEPVKSQIEVQGTPEIRQEMPPSDENNYQLPNKQRLYSGFQRPKTRAMTTASDNQPSQQEEVWHCHEHDEKQGKFEGQSRLPKEKPVKITVVPLASKEQLRSRIKRQSQDSA